MRKLEREMKKNQVGVRAWHVSYKNEARASGWINNRRVREYIAHYLVLFAEHREAISRGSGSVLFPVACLHYPRTALKTVGEWKRQIWRGASKRSRHVKRARDRTRETIRCREAKHLTDRHSRRDRHRHGCKMLRAIHSRSPRPPRGNTFVPVVTQTW